jgi:hypothetical protein
MKALEEMSPEGFRILSSAISGEAKRRAKVESDNKHPSEMSDAEFIRWACKQIKGDDE